MSHQIQSLKTFIFNTLEFNQEFLCLSIDATLKVCMNVQGQANYRASAQVRNAACFDDQNSSRRVLTIRGRTGAVLGILPVPSEESPKIRECLAKVFSTQALSQVRYLATDNPFPKLFRELADVCPNLRCLCLDPVHLAIVYEYAQWGKKTAGSKILRCLLQKVNQIAPQMRSDSWGQFFTGSAPPSLSRDEERVRKLILDGSMGAARAKRILENLDVNVPLFCRVTFIEVLAALCAAYPKEVCRKVTGSNKEIRKLLWAAASPDRMEWLFNNLRVRHSMSAEDVALLPSGTSSNESLHAEINAWTKPIRSLHQSTLRMKCEIMQFGKVLAHHVASCFPTVRQTSETILRGHCRKMSGPMQHGRVFVQQRRLPYPFTEHGKRKQEKSKNGRTKTLLRRRKNV